jgi:hypothetical protein
MRDDWYYSGPEGQKGPVSLQQLKNTLAAHPNADDVFIWHDSLSDWIRAGDVAEIFADDDPADGIGPSNSAGPSNWASAPQPLVREPQTVSSGLLLGMIVLLVGCLLFYLGISGNVARVARALGLTTEIAEASPGALLFVVGLLMVWATRYKVSVK